MFRGNSVIRAHAWRNRLQTALLVLTLFGVAGLAGMLLFGESGLWVALTACVATLVLEPAASPRLTLRLYRARPIAPQQAPQVWQVLHEIADRAGLPRVPALHYVPSPVPNAFAVGNPGNAAIAISDGLLRTLDLRETAGVLAHEVAHIANGDLRVMNLADFISRLTMLCALASQILLLLALPWLFAGYVEIQWTGWLLIAVSPYIALAAQMGLSRVREFDADLEAARLCGDPRGLACALARIETGGRSWWRWVLPGWGNPDPSWLRSHPPTAERVRRLLSIEQAAAATLPPQGRHHFPHEMFPPPRRIPRWRIGGHWW